jgi:AraC family transcriptional regulator, dual regulator of chb operon
MTKQELKKQLYQYTTHEQIYKTYYELKTKEQKEEYLRLLKQTDHANEKLWLPGFFNIDNLLFSEQILFESNETIKKSIVIQKHNRYTPAKKHQHEFFEMIYVYSGNAVHEIQNTKQTISAGDVLIIAPQVTHSLSVFDDSIIIDALIRKGTFSNHFFKFLKKDNILASFFQRDLYSNQHQPCITFHTGNDKELETLLFDMFLEHEMQDELSDDILNNLCLVYFAKLVRLYQHQVEIFSPIVKESEQLLRIITYIQNHYNQVTLQSVATHFHYAPAYLSNYIKEHTGQTFLHFVKTAKLNRAEYLLLNSNLSIQEICLEIGYESPAHFIRLFKEIYHLSPSKFRKKNSSPFS